jgi:hypothetical protein
MNRPTNERVTQQVGREICQRTNGKALVVGSISNEGAVYLIGLKAVNCQSGDLLANIEEQARNRDTVLNQLQEAANQLRRKLGESLGSIEKYSKPLDEATTSSLEALKAFSEG